MALQMRFNLQKASPYLIHLIMVISVTLYTLFGAYCIRALENANINKINRKNGFMDGGMKRVRRSGEDFVLTGSELAAVAPGLRPCVEKAIKEMLLLGSCNSEELKTLSITAIDDCYRYAEINVNKSQKVVEPETRYRFLGGLEEKDAQGWTFHNSIVFAYTLITTIGYGNVAPETVAGRVFCLFYGLVGVPLALLTIADIGMFLNKSIHQLATLLASTYKRYKKKQKSPSSAHSNGTVKLNGSLPNSPRSPPEEEDEISVGSQRRPYESVMLAVIFALYLIFGSFVISLYEPEMNFFTSFYFNFISLTTIGLGDVVPKNDRYLVITFAYLTVGLALTTMAIEIAADFLKKVHYFGRKIDATSAEIWFGGRKMKLKSLIKNLGDQLNIPIDELESFNINNFVENSMKVVQGEIKSLRTPLKPVEFDDLKKHENENANFVDEEYISYTSEETPLQTARSTGSAKANKPSQSAR